MSSLSPEQIKAATRQAWEKSADGWNRQTPQIHAWLAPATVAMLDSAHISAGMRVLDIAAGAGDQTLDIARRVGPGGHIAVLVFSEPQHNPCIGILMSTALQHAGLPPAGDYLSFVRTSASPIMQLLGQLDAAAQAAAWAAMKDKLQAFQSPSGWAGPNELLLTHGTRPAQ